MQVESLNNIIAALSGRGFRALTTPNLEDLSPCCKYHELFSSQ